MRSAADGFGYNERLFAGGVRGFLHVARFRFVREAVERHRIDHSSVLELGCFDGKLIEHLPRRPAEYHGFDANWEGGLELARDKWGHVPGYRFDPAEHPRDIALPAGKRFPLTVSMETLEHVPPDIVDAYLATLAERTDGWLIVTVPNEKGPLFLAKWATKRLFSKGAERYRAAEVLNATLGRMDRVARNQHKGFDYAEMIRQISVHFDVVEVAGHPFGDLPTWMCFGIGIVARSRRPSGAG